MGYTRWVSAAPRFGSVLRRYTRHRKEAGKRVPPRPTKRFLFGRRLGD